MSLLRRLILAFALVASIVPAFAQAPPPVPALPDSERRTSYSITSSTCTCAVNFALYGDSTDYQNWIEVWVNGTLVNYNDPTYGWTITSPTGPLASIPRPVTDAVLTFNSAQTGTVQIVGARRPRRMVQVQNGQGVAARDFNLAITDLVAQNRETWDKINDFTGRAIVGVPGDDFNPLPPASTRAGKYLGFDTNGLPTLFTSSGQGTPGVSSVAITPGTGISLSGTCSSANLVNCQINGLHGVSPGNLYVSTTGNDSNNCLTAGAPCLTIQHAANLAMSYDLGGAPITINLAAGTYTQGAYISGTLPGNARGSGSAPMVQIVGAGSTVTTINTSSNCAAGDPFHISNGAIVGIGSVKLTTTCSGQNNMTILAGAIGYLVDNDVNFGTAPSNGAQIYVLKAKFDANFNGSKSFTVSGGANNMFQGTSQAQIVTGVGVTNTLVGNPAFSIFLSLFDNSLYIEGGNSTWAGTATGTRYSIALNSTMDREQSTQLLPGSTPGRVQGISAYYANGLVGGVSIDTPCIGGSGGCRNATAPTGLGTGGLAALATGSNDHSGAVILTFGTSPPTTGSVVVAPVSVLLGDYGSAGFCVTGMNNVGSAWPSGSNIQSWFDTGGIHITWNGTMSASTTYSINYVCN